MASLTTQKAMAYGGCNKVFKVTYQAAKGGMVLCMGPFSFGFNWFWAKRVCKQLDRGLIITAMRGRGIVRILYCQFYFSGRCGGNSGSSSVPAIPLQFKPIKEVFLEK